MIDWRTRFVDAFLSGDKANREKHKETTRKQFLNGLEKQLSSHKLSLQGPYVICNDITYGDLVMYQICYDEQLLANGCAGLKSSPRLAKMCQAIEA